jgi:hypothetical protein
MYTVELVLTEVQELFYKGNQPVMVCYELDKNRVVQLMRCVIPFITHGITY